MLKKINSLCTEYFLLFTAIIICVELINITVAFVNGSLEYLHIAYVLIGLIGVICGLKKLIAGKWFLLLFFGLQIIFIKTLDFEFGFTPSVSLPLSFNSHSSENGQLTKLFLIKVNLLAIYFIRIVNKFYADIKREKLLTETDLNHSEDDSKES